MEVPAAIPMARAPNTKAVSLVSLTTVRKRIMDNAPTKAKAFARLDPITIMTMATTKETNRIVCVNA